MSIGHLYIVNNEEEHGLNCFKVGFTSDLKRRLDDFNSATTTIGEYKLQGYIITKDVEEVEKRVHKSLNSYRVRRDREFFRCSLSKINNAILENSHDLIFENHLRGGVFITPQGKKYENFLFPRVVTMNHRHASHRIDKDIWSPSVLAISKRMTQFVPKNRDKKHGNQY